MWDDDEDEPGDEGLTVNWTPGGDGRGDDPRDWSDEPGDDNTIDWRKWE
jgi:hypothetical protein